MLPVSTTDISERSIRISRLRRFISLFRAKGNDLNSMQAPCKNETALAQIICSGEARIRASLSPKMPEATATTSVLKETNGLHPAERAAPLNASGRPSPPSAAVLLHSPEEESVRLAVEMALPARRFCRIP